MNKNIFTLLFLVFCMAGSQLAVGQVLYSEDFEGTGGVMPANMTIIDNDASPAAAGIPAYDLWIPVGSTIAVGTDTVAAVTSWLNPVGASDDWLITPLVTGLASNANLLWNAVARDAAYRDGYEVWVTSTIAGTTPVVTDFTTNGTMVFSVAEEDSVITNHIVSLTAFANQSVYVAFRNNSNNQFILEVDDIVVENTIPTDDLAINGVYAEYTIYPLTQAEIPVIGTIANVGNTNASDAVLTANVYEGTTLQQTFTSPATTLLPNASVNLTLGTYTALNAGVHTVEYIVSSATLNDVDATNDTIRYSFLVDANFFARDDANFLSGVGADETTELIAGQNYDMVNAGEMDSVLFFIAPGGDGFGDTVQVVLYDVVGGVPTNQIGQSQPYILTAADTGASGTILQLPVTNMSGSTFTFAPSEIFVGIREYTTSSYMNLVSTVDIYTAGTVYGNVDGSAFTSIDNIFAGFQRNFVIRPYTSIICPTLTATNSATDASCGLADGTATAIPGGGTAPYTFMWDANTTNQTTATANNLTAGNYNFTFTDANGCSGTGGATVANPNAPITTASVTNNATCNAAADGEAGATATGGSGTYTYVWSDGQTTPDALNLAAGTYTVTTTDGSNCASTAMVTITEPTAVVVSSTNTVDVACFGDTTGSATVAATGGNGAYTYMWAANTNNQIGATAINLAGGAYVVTATDASGCTATATVAIAQPSRNLLVTINPNSNVNITCNGAATGSSTASAFGGTPSFTYMWGAAANNQMTAAATNLAAGTYIVTVTDANGCTATRSTTLTEPTALVATATNNGNGTATLAGNGGSGAYTYSWSNGETTANATFTSNGSYTGTVTDANGCTSVDSVNITVISVDQIAGLNTLNVFPNPATTIAMVDIDLAQAQEVSLRVINTTGQVVINKVYGTIQSSRLEVATTELTTGVYFLQFTIGAEVVTKKLVVSKQ